jgi:hypothetical protein
MQLIKKSMSLFSKNTPLNIITSLDQLPALTRSWLAPLETEDFELYEELARDIVINLTEITPHLDAVLPAGHEDVRRVLGTIDLVGKQIGEFYFAPAPNAGSTVEEQLEAHNNYFRNLFMIEGDGACLGTFGEDWVIATTGDLALLRRESEADVTLLPLSKDFGSFILAQANAFKRFIVEKQDLRNYRKAQNACAAHPIFRDTNVPLIFDCQLKA